MEPDTGLIGGMAGMPMGGVAAAAPMTVVIHAVERLSGAPRSHRRKRA